MVGSQLPQCDRGKILSYHGCKVITCSCIMSDQNQDEFHI